MTNRLEKIKVNIIYMSITGDIYNNDLSLTGDGIIDLELSTLIVEGTFQDVNADYFKNITSPIQDQLDIKPNKNTSNIFTGSLNSFDAIQFSSVKFSNSITNTPAIYYDGLRSNIQQQIDTLKSGSPINGQSATISIGTTTTLSAGQNASVTNSGNNLDAIFNFGIPRGITPTLEIGNVTTDSTANVTIDNSILTNPKLNFTLVNGTNGITPTFSINSVVDNLSSSSTPTITLTDDLTIANNKIFKFGLVRGVDGTDGITPTFSINSVVDNLSSGSTPTITLDDDPTIVNNKIFKFGLVRGVDGTDGITPTFSIGSVSSVPYGQTASVTIDNTILTNPALDFVLITGEKGNPGDSSAATAAAITSVAAATAALTTTAAAATSASAAATSAGTAAGSATSAAESAATATAAVRHFTATDLPNKETLNGELIVKDITGISSVISLNQSGDISTKNSIAVNPTGLANVFIANSNGNLTTTGRISLDNEKITTTSNQTNIAADTINIGGTATPSTINIGVGTGLDTTTANTINIGNAASSINLFGNVNGFIKQETTGTRYIPAIPFTAW